MLRSHHGQELKIGTMSKTQQDTVIEAPIDLTPSSTELLAPGVRREWLCGNQVVVYVATDVHRESIDAWVAAFKADINMCPPGQTFRVIHDFSARAIMATPYARQRAEELTRYRPEIPARVAMIFPKTIFATVLSLFISQHINSTRERKMFATREEAVRWLFAEPVDRP
jgi:hypothetical protein